MITSLITKPSLHLCRGYRATGLVCLLMLASSADARLERTRHRPVEKPVEVVLSKEPADFAYGAEIAVDGKSPFYRLELPQQVYLQSEWADFRDLRLFNHDNQMVPFALSEPYQQVTSAAKTFTARIFPMRHSASAKTNNTDVTLSSLDGVEVQFKQAKGETAAAATYLIDIPDRQVSDRPVSRLKFIWPQSKDNWQVTAKVYGGSSLKSIEQLVASGTPLMDLSSGGERLQQDYIDIRPDASHRVWLLVLSAEPGTKIPEINVALASTVAATDVYVERVELPFELQAGYQADSAEYRLLSTQPLTSLLIESKLKNSVLPVEIYWRNSDKAEWRYLRKSVIYQLNEQQSGSLIELPTQGISQIRLKAVNSGWGDTPPSVIGMRQKQDIIFNAAGNGPFLMTWGATHALPVFMRLDELLPKGSVYLTDNGALPYAAIGPAVAQQVKPAVITDSSDDKPASVGWQRFLIWALLIGGAVGLIFIVLNLWRDLSKAKKETPEE